MRKVPVLLIAILLVSSTAVIATADVDLGFSQTMYSTYYRLDVQNFYFEVPVEGDVKSFHLGGQLDTTFWDLYGTGAVEFETNSDAEFYPEKLALGIGYPIEFGPMKIFGEMRVSSPKWLDVNTWSAEPYIGLQFTWSAFRQTVPEK